MNPHERHAHQLLTELEQRQDLSQRTLAQRLGIALGLTNLLIKRLVRKGWIKVVRIRPNRVRYLLTSAGLVEKTRMSRMFLMDSVQFYLTARDRIRATLAEAESGSGHRSRRVVFLGTGEVAEIAYICLQETDLRLVAVVGEPVGRPFFGLPVQSEAAVRDGFVGATAFDRIIVTSFNNHEAARARLEASGVPPERVCWL